MARTRHYFIRTLQLPSQAPFDLAWSNQSGWEPRVDVYQTESEFVVLVEAPGVPFEDISLHYENGQLIVQGRRESPAPLCSQHCLQVEISYGNFRRVIPLPGEIESENIKADFQAGILRIHAPRRIRKAASIKVTIG